VPRARAPSPQTVLVLRALAAQPATWRHGYDLAREVALRSGSLYPILIRLADRDLLETAWETDAPHPGRPPRHLYRLTPTGVALAADLERASRDRPVVETRPHVATEGGL
jgi:PadR family transcriptional regulator PadR